MAEDFSKEITTESTPNTTPTEELTPDSEIEFQTKINQIKDLIDFQTKNQEQQSRNPSNIEAVKALKQRLTVAFNKLIEPSYVLVMSDVQDVINIYYELVSIQVNPLDIEKMKLPSLIKLIKESANDSSNAFIKELARISLRVLSLWKKTVAKAHSYAKIQIQKNIQINFDENYVSNPFLRKQACYKIYLRLLNNGFKDQLAKDLSVKIECTLRKRDPQMDMLYRKNFRIMFSQLKNLQAEEFQRCQNEVNIAEE